MYGFWGSPEEPVFGTAFLDARGLVADQEGYEDVEDKVRILGESPAIPNSPVAFGPDFPADLRRQIEKAMVKLADPEGPDYAIWETSLWEDSSLDKLKKKEFDFLKSAIEAAGIAIGDL
jgi:ABC-type phosphate/phosphonate transport system substrate-binding protein